MLIVVGGHSRGSGKTSLVLAIIRGLRELEWTAVKISGHSHDAASWRLAEERDAGGAADSCRYLAAGAQRSFWLSAGESALSGAVPSLHEVLDASPHAIVESNTILEFLEPDLYLMALDYRAAEFKDSAMRWLHRADAFALVDAGTAAPPWAGLIQRCLKPLFRLDPEARSHPELTLFIRNSIHSAPQH